MGVTTARRDRVPILALLTANVISQTGSTLTGVAVPWFVLVTTGSAAKTGLTGAAALLPVVLAGVFGGTLVDRVGLRRMSVVADLCSGVAVALIPIFYHTTGLAFWELLVLLFLGELCANPGGTARTALVPELAEQGNLSLERANAALGAALNMSGLLGPVLAGVLIVAVGADNVLFLDAGSFAISAGLVALLVPAVAATQDAAQERPSYLTELREGLHLLRLDRVLLPLFLAAAVVNFTVVPLVAVVLPVYARQVLGSAFELGAILSAIGAGTLIGTIAYGILAQRLPRYHTLLGALLAFALLLTGLVLLPGFAITLLLLGVAGLTVGPINPMIETMIQRRVPLELRGRIFGLLMAFASGISPLGIVIGGLLLQYTSLRLSVGLVTGLLLAVAVGLWFVPSLRQLKTA
ncbi:MAG TPA: MFS transporter [Thermomicrobiaceae bacterium]|nr:MFS transporter [Thermomicrobiaceae bacterium]